MSQLFIDSHAHLDGEAYSDDLEDVLRRADEAGITHMVCIGASHEMKANYETIALAEAYDHIYASVGVHPHDASIVTDAVLAEIERLAGSERVVAIGETGLDYHYDHSPRDVQQRAFRASLQLARELKYPAVVHTRTADEDTIEILVSENAQDIGGVLHSFTGGDALADTAIDLGWYVSFSGIITFKSAEPLRQIAKRLPRDRVLVETDCPYLTPVPYRGKRNEPSYVVHTASKLAELWDVPLDEAKRQTGENAARLFGIPKV